MSFLKHLSLTPSVEDPGVPVTERIEPHTSDAQPPRVVVVADEAGVSVDELLLAVARGDREAMATLRTRMGGLVRTNILRVLRDASRADEVTEAFFAEVPREAVSFDPNQCSAQGWLLTRAHQRAVDEGAPDVPGPGSARA